jgi:uncharacterized protein
MLWTALKPKGDTHTVLIYILFFATGALAGTLSGLLGIGGGIIVVPALAWIFTYHQVPSHYIMQLAVGTSLAAMIVTSAVSAQTYHKCGNLDLKVFKQAIPGLILGVIGGSIVSSFVHSRVIAVILGVVLCIVGLRLLFFANAKPKRTLPKHGIILGFALIISFFSGLLGIGGGVFIVPLLIYCSLPMRKASGTSALSSLPIAIVGTISYIISGWHQVNYPHTLGFIQWPAFLAIIVGSALFVKVGNWLGGVINTVWLKRLFAILLFAVAWQLLVS